MSRLTVFVSAFLLLIASAACALAAPLQLTHADRNAVRALLRREAKSYLATLPKQYVRPSVRTLFLREHAKQGPKDSVGVFVSIYARSAKNAPRKAVAHRTVSAIRTEAGMQVAPVAPLPAWGMK